MERTDQLIEKITKPLFDLLNDLFLINQKVVSKTETNITVDSYFFLSWISQNFKTYCKKLF